MAPLPFGKKQVSCVMSGASYLCSFELSYVVAISFIERTTTIVYSSV